MQYQTVLWELCKRQNNNLLDILKGTLVLPSQK
jgi:hypothetical protein